MLAGSRLTIEAIIDTPKNRLHLLSTFVSSQQIKGNLASKSAVRTVQPVRRLLQRAKSINRLGNDPRYPSHALALVRR